MEQLTKENDDFNGGENQDLDVEPINIVRLGSEELDTQITTAKRFPRSIKKFQQEAMSMALVDQDTASSCFYVLERKDRRTGEVNRIEGPGVRLSEIIANAWENLYCASRVVGETEDRRFIIGEGVAWDLERNVRRTERISRRITNRYGKRYGDDMIGVTANAACAIAVRNAIFKVVPRAYVDIVYRAAKELAIGNAVSLQDRRKKMLEHFSKMGVNRQQILEKVDKPSIEDIGLAELEVLVGLSTAIRDGDVSVQDTFFQAPEAEPTEEAKPKNPSEKVAAKARTIPMATGEIKRGRGRPKKDQSALSESDIDLPPPPMTNSEE